MKSPPCGTPSKNAWQISNTLDLLRDGKLSDAGTNTAETSVPAGIRTVTITSRISSKTKTKPTTNQTKKEVKQRKAVVRDHIHNSRYGEEDDEDSEESGFFEE